MKADAFVINNRILEKYNGDEKEVIIPAGITSIGDYAFYRCTEIEFVTIPSGVTSIGEEAFMSNAETLWGIDF